MNTTNQISFSSVLKRTGKTIETVLSVVDIVDDGIAIATNYMSRVREEQLKEQEQKAVEFDNNLKLREANSVIEFKASAYQIGNKAIQLENMVAYQENMEAFEKLLK